ncbi:TonB-dependent receptor [Methylococcus sp. EFPC2]|uniref:TonB-dependent receptor n=1 Tax=Methylococcus sp. EFPC2 TaxID=2812648 RepID=UPI001967DDC0|nr:TonB-dependent receptor [Methylococcus sp. EFPC2]QSA98664.1 TonB-dependent receptor [Methylococcus sp. EFPC2]
MRKQFLILAASAGTFALSVQAENQPIQELEAVVVTAPLRDKATESAVPVTVLKDDDLRRKIGHSIGETLKQELGITSQSFGPGVGTPVIRGQSGPRVRVLANGIGSNDASAVSPDHATSVEPLLAERIEVLRGPATLLYGSGAMGGVVNVIDNRIPGFRPDKLFGGAVEQRYDSASDETSTALKAEGGQGEFAYHLDGFYRERNNLDIGGRGIDVGAVSVTDPSLNVVSNPEGTLPNTWGHAISGSAGASWVGEPGFAGVSINRLENNYGIAPDGTGEEFVRIDLRQTKYDFKSELDHPFGFAKALRTRLGYTDYQHTEIANGAPGAFFTNQSYEGRVELTHEDWGPVRGAVGFQATASDFSATEKLTGATIVPRSQINSYGIFAVESLDFGSVTYQLGTRVEETTLAPEDVKDLSYTPVSASASALWKVDQGNQLSLAITRSSRAPQVQELLSNGFHDATRSYERGDLKLKEETSYNLDLGYRFKSDWMRAEFDLFHNWATDYIFQQRTGEFVDEEGNPCQDACVPVLTSAQGEAIFKGYEAKLVFPVMENRWGLLDLTLYSDYTRGEFVRGGDVPRMPPLRYGVQFDHTADKWTSYLRLTRAESQPHGGEHETATAAYLLLNIGTQYQVEAFHDAKLTVFAKGNNLLDDTIRNSTSYLRNFAPEAGRGAEVGLRISY